MLLNWLRKSTQVKPYSQLASIYDYVMRHVDYDRWANYLQRTFQKTEIDIKTVLDISCGTGNLLMRLQAKGFRSFGFDSSRQMATIAHRKAQHAQNIPLIWLANMCRFRLHNPVEAIYCTYDSVNYCPDIITFSALLQSVGSALTVGGIFVFDVSTIRNSKRYFHDYTDRDGADGFEYVRHSHFETSTQTQINEFYIIFQEASKACYYEKHQQHIYSIAELLKAIPRDIFAIVGVYDDFSFRPGSEKSDRVHFVLKRIT